MRASTATKRNSLARSAVRSSKGRYQWDVPYSQTGGIRSSVTPSPLKSAGSSSQLTELYSGPADTS